MRSFYREEYAKSKSLDFLSRAQGSRTKLKTWSLV